MGGDFGPSVTVPAALQALNSNSQLTLLLVGNPDAITPLLAKADFEQRSRLQIIPAQSVIASDARPSQAIRASRGSSMRVALELVKEGRAQACVSAPYKEKLMMAYVKENTCNCLRGQLMLPNTPVLQGFGSYSGCNCTAPSTPTTGA